MPPPAQINPPSYTLVFPSCGKILLILCRGRVLCSEAVMGLEAPVSWARGGEWAHTPRLHPLSRPSPPQREMCPTLSFSHSPKYAPHLPPELLPTMPLPHLVHVTSRQVCAMKGEITRAVANERDTFLRPADGSIGVLWPPFCTGQRPGGGQPRKGPINYTQITNCSPSGLVLQNTPHSRNPEKHVHLENFMQVVRKLVK